MKSHNRKILSLAVMTGCLAILAGNFDAAAQPKTKHVAKVRVAEKNTDLMVPVGASARFEAPYKKGNKYQWVKNSESIKEATNSFYLISAVTREDVALYSVLVTSGSEYPEVFVSCPTTLSAYSTTNGGRTTQFLAPMSASATTNAGGGVIGTGGTKGTCPGNYAGYEKYKDPSSGSYWWPRPAGTTQCTSTDQSTYTAIVEVVESGTLMRWCGTKTVTLPTRSPPTKYQFTTYFKTMYPPIPGEVVAWSVTWF